MNLIDGASEYSTVGKLVFGIGVGDDVGKDEACIVGKKEGKSVVPIAGDKVGDVDVGLVVSKVFDGRDEGHLKSSVYEHNKQQIIVRGDFVSYRSTFHSHL